MRTKQSVKVQVTFDESKTTVRTDRGLSFELGVNGNPIDNECLVSSFVGSLLNSTILSVVHNCYGNKIDFELTVTDYEDGKEE